MKNKYLSHHLSHGLVAAWVQYGAYHPGDEVLNCKLGIVVAKKAKVYLSHIDRIDGDPPHHLRRRRGRGMRGGSRTRLPGSLCHRRM